MKLRSLFDDSAEEREKAMTADEWIAHRARLRNTANFKDADTFNASRGTEHMRGRGKATLDKPAAAVEVV